MRKKTLVEEWQDVNESVVALKEAIANVPPIRYLTELLKGWFDA